MVSLGTSKSRIKRKNAGSSAVSLLTFVAGIALIAFAFWQAYTLFQTPPSVQVSGNEDQPLNLDDTVQSVLNVLIRVLLLVVMAAFGSMIASRGIKLYGAPAIEANKAEKQKKKQQKSEPEKAESA